ncbi:unnamed protein product [Bursaphelenchus okinawaensis]|uniref:Condensin-2 complex subunit H2 C-terminal domain-containing protein n=1 Tax=Bursaphelenchus okinawaensis TaxID=465554 RepID=A0A811LJK7_9BILA|nr:unnamed protein product [Bursaphelenchus okinawaensis]CAG9123643.1 unnamed protein product [Bursaphelenchus okinawaensis]
MAESADAKCIEEIRNRWKEPFLSNLLCHRLLIDDVLKHYEEIKKRRSELELKGQPSTKKVDFGSKRELKVQVKENIAHKVMATIERSQKALKAFKTILTELSKTNGKPSEQHLNFIKEQFKSNKLTQRVNMNGPKELEGLAVNYATYLNSSRELAELNEKYKGREKSVEESARLMDEDEARIARYRYLLQPIRDLSEHLDDDIYEILGVYLEKLRSDRERNVQGEDGELIKFNFSEAAVLLQSSFQLFAKKVDRLYDLVCEAYSGTVTKKKGKKSGIGDSSDETDITRRKNDFDFKVDIDSLTSSSVDLKWLLEQDKKREHKVPVKVGQLRIEGERDRLVDLPISFMPTKKTVPSQHYVKFTHGNEAMSIRQDELFAFSSVAYASNEAEQMTVLMNVAYLPLINEITHSLEPFRNMVDVPETQPEQHVESPQHVEDQPQDDYASAGGFEPEEIAPEAGMAMELPPTTTHTDISQSQAIEIGRRDTDARTLDPRPSTVMSGAIPACDSQIGMNESTRSKKRVVKNWREKIELMDDFEPLEVKRKPLQQSRTHIKRAEQQVEKRDKLIREQLAAKGIENQENSLGAYITARMFSRKLTKAGSALANLNPSLRSKQMQALNTVLYAQEKYEARILKQRKEAEKQRRKEIQAAEREKRLSQRRSGLMNESTGNGRNGPVRNSLFNGTEVDLPVDNFGVLPENDDDSADSDEEEQTAAALLAQEVNEALGDEYVDDPAEEVDIELPETQDEPAMPVGDLSRPNMEELAEFNECALEMEAEYAMFVKEHPILDQIMEDMHNGTQNQIFKSIYNYWNKTDSGKINNKGKRQIQEWNQRIANRLAEEESHKPFDIHSYGTDVINAFGEGENAVGSSKTMPQVLQGSDRYEKSRFLLATLILANCGNVEIKAVPPADGQPPTNNVTLKLLSRKRHHEVFADEQRLITG